MALDELTRSDAQAPAAPSFCRSRRITGQCSPASIGIEQLTPGYCSRSFRSPLHVDEPWRLRSTNHAVCAGTALHSSSLSLHGSGQSRHGREPRVQQMRRHPDGLMRLRALRRERPRSRRPASPCAARRSRHEPSKRERSRRRLELGPESHFCSPPVIQCLVQSPWDREGDVPRAPTNTERIQTPLVRASDERPTFLRGVTSGSEYSGAETLQIARGGASRRFPRSPGSIDAFTRFARRTVTPRRDI
jgi:hypothetical protein